jgi:hypothetical protein
MGVKGKWAWPGASEESSSVLRPKSLRWQLERLAVLAGLDRHRVPEDGLAALSVGDRDAVGGLRLQPTDFKAAQLIGLDVLRVPLVSRNRTRSPVRALAIPTR